MTHLLRLALSLVCAVALVAAVRLYASPLGQGEAASLVRLQLPTDEAQTLALERAVNSIRVNTYHQPERTPSGKLRSVARFWAVVYQGVAVDVESTKLAGLIFDTLKVSEFNPSPAPYYAVLDEPGLYSPDAIAETWRAAIFNYWIFQTPNYQFQGCSYNSTDGRTRAFCVLADTLDETPTATPQPTPMPLGRPAMPTSRPLPTRTPTPIWGRP